MKTYRIRLPNDLEVDVFELLNLRDCYILPNGDLKIPLTENQKMMLMIYGATICGEIFGG